MPLLAQLPLHRDSEVDIRPVTRSPTGPWGGGRLRLTPTTRPFGRSGRRRSTAPQVFRRSGPFPVVGGHAGGSPILAPACVGRCRQVRLREVEGSGLVVATEAGPSEDRAGARTGRGRRCWSRATAATLQWRGRRPGRAPRARLARPDRLGELADRQQQPLRRHLGGSGRSYSAELLLDDLTRKMNLAGRAGSPVRQGGTPGLWRQWAPSWSPRRCWLNSGVARPWTNWSARAVRAGVAIGAIWSTFCRPDGTVGRLLHDLASSFARRILASACDPDAGIAGISAAVARRHGARRAGEGAGCGRPGRPGESSPRSGPGGPRTSPSPRCAVVLRVDRLTAG